ncbi:carbon-nitrogen hydrolase family protein [Moraxella bovoculi]|uniref:carbon-nitrogen hydrolase family protein n=1 Tax=Moraxella bovoculi TaxID=386891 RepID=UPI0006249133|nr:carbon-nitrogen hydrolase family protein [Moraxella bovoculi]AKG15715.2 carbon-nitrogen hydrolase [Moraxella bovoculi]
MSIRIAAIQLNSQTDIDANLDIITRAVAETVSLADVIVLPENMCVMGRQGELAARFDEVSRHLSELAKSHGVHIVAGTLPCAIRADGTAVPQGKYRQTSLVFSPSGEQIARYDKIHLFRATVNDSTGSYDEGKTFEAGDQLVVTPLYIHGQTIQLGMMICFDVRFPAMAQHLRQMGADIITVPAAFTHKTGEAHWQLLLQARALDSQCMVIGSTQGGTHHIGGNTRQTWGHALITNAHGKVIADTQMSDIQGDYLAVFATFDKDEQTKIRQSMPIFDCHRLA